jgi:hypothetical protein
MTGCTMVRGWSYLETGQLQSLDDIIGFLSHIASNMEKSCSPIFVSAFVLSLILNAVFIMHGNEFFMMNPMLKTKDNTMTTIRYHHDSKAQHTQPIVQSIKEERLRDMDEDNPEAVWYHHRSLDEEYAQDLRTIGSDIDPNIYKNLSVNVVFFAYLAPDKFWWYALENYAELVMHIGLLDRADSFHICLSTTSNDNWMTDLDRAEWPSDHTREQLVLKNATEIMSRILAPYIHKVHFDLTIGNLFEFPGVVKVWNLANAVKDIETAKKSVYLYFHAKGIAMHGQLERVKLSYTGYFYKVVAQYKYALKYFALDDMLDVSNAIFALICE